MPAITFNRQSLMIDGRRQWIVGGSMHYTRTPRSEWAARIQDVKSAGMNTIEVAAPWMLHEAKRDHWDFDGGLDVRSFIEACAAADMFVILRAGPYVGAGYDGGGLPAWLSELPDTTIRTANETFLDRTGRWYRRLFGEIADLQVTEGGPILLVQAEHRWQCSNEEQATAYLRQLARMIREFGINVPTVGANGMWAGQTAQIEAWHGFDDALGALRFIGRELTDTPRLALHLEVADRPLAGTEVSDPPSPAMVLRRAAEVLAAGGQYVVGPFHGGTNFGFMGGQMAGGTMATSAAAGAPLGEAGATSDTYRALKRLSCFARDFGSVFASLDPDAVPTILAPPDPQEAGTRSKRAATVTAIPLHGDNGSVIFVMSDRPGTQSRIMLDDGYGFDVALGDQFVGWYLQNVDLGGRARLDYASAMPAMLVDRSILVLAGAPKTEIEVSLNGTPRREVVPTSGKPVVFELHDVTVVVVSQAMLDQTFACGDRVVVGAAGVDPDGEPISNGSRMYAVQNGGRVTTINTKKPASGADPAKLGPWEGAAATSRVDGSSPRFARIKGPATLPECGAVTGYGWYRMTLKNQVTRSRTMLAPGLGHRMRLSIDGVPDVVVGNGPDADDGTFQLKLAKGTRTLTAFVENIGRLAGGNDMGERTGLFEHLCEVKPLALTKLKTTEIDPPDPFELRGWIDGVSRGRALAALSHERHFKHLKKSELILEVRGQTPGLLLLNGEMLAWFSGSGGIGRLRVRLNNETHPIKRGENTLVFVPLRHPTEAAPSPSYGRDSVDGTTLFEVVDEVTAKADWGFARWAPPTAGDFGAISANAARELGGLPAWWRCRFDDPGDGEPLWVDVAGMSRGCIMVNGEVLGRYFVRVPGQSGGASGGKAGNAATRVRLPSGGLRATGNELLIFDEYASHPGRVRIVRDRRGDHDSPGG